MKQYEKDLWNQMNGDFDSAEGAAAPAAPAPAPSKEGVLSARPGNPKGKSKFSLNVLLKFGSAGVEITPAALPAAAQNPVPFIGFGNADYNGGYEKALSQFNDDWLFYRSGVWQRDISSLNVPPIENYLDTGDYVIEWQVDVGGTLYWAYTIIKSPNIAYGNLLNSTNSDTFFMNNIRFSINDLTQLAQFDESIIVYNVSLFGKSVFDTIVPSDLKSPEQYQNGIIDIPLARQMNKATGFAMAMNYTLGSFTWSFNVIETQTI